MKINDLEFIGEIETKNLNPFVTLKIDILLGSSVVTPIYT